MEKKPRGFATLDPARVKEIASRGGKAAHAKGVAHRWTLEETRKYGRKGGLRSGHRWDREEATVAGAKGNASRTA